MTATRKKTPAKGKTTKKKPTRATKGRTSAKSEQAATKGQAKRKAPKRATSASSAKSRKAGPAAKRKQPAAESKAKAPPAKAKGNPGVGGSSILDAAVRVLRENKKPMRCKKIMEVVLAKNYWTTKGKTPHATLYSAILREITNKGKDSRFKKVERGLFTLASANTKK